MIGVECFSAGFQYRDRLDRYRHSRSGQPAFHAAGGRQCAWILHLLYDGKLLIATGEFDGEQSKTVARKYTKQS